MKTILRVFLTFTGAVFALFLLVMITLLSPVGRVHGAIGFAIAIVRFYVAFIVGRWIWRKSGQIGAPSGVLACVGIGALAIGGFGFLAGFLGPMFLSKSNLGPLLGFITGPLGGIVGALVGLVVGLANKEKRNEAEKVL